MTASDHIPVTVLTGFLGSGKTTVLNHLLRQKELNGVVAIINEFGEVALDHLLVESSEDRLALLDNGCICCSVRGELVDRLADIVDRLQTGRLPPIERVLMETTGMAAPTPVLTSMMGHPVLAQAYALDGVVTLVDAHAGLAGIDGRVEAERQVAVADRIVLTKTDLLDADAYAEVREFLREQAPRQQKRRGQRRRAEDEGLASGGDHRGLLHGYGGG